MIPAPPIELLQLGPVKVHLYSICILIGVVIAFYLTKKRLSALGHCTCSLINLTLISVFAGVVGARIYHVLTAWDYYKTDLKMMFAISNGGLGIWGAIIFGGLALILANGYLAPRAQNPLATSALITALLPGLMVAQSIGRIGNWFNQELYGRNTSLIWGLQVDGEIGTFHPVFAYESLWLLIGAVVVARVRGAGRAFASYAAWYSVGRFAWELLRIDPSPVFGGLRWNGWVSLLTALISISFLIINNPSMRVKLSGIAAVTVILIDQSSKSLLLKFLDHPIYFFDNVGLLLVTNSGAAFSFLSGYTFLFTIIGIIILFLGWYGRKRILMNHNPVAVGVLAGGIIGNLLDRVLRAPSFLQGEVVDFISISSFPVFNFADIAIFTSLLIAIFHSREQIQK